MSPIKQSGNPAPVAPSKISEAMRNAVSAEDLTNE